MGDARPDDADHVKKREPQGQVDEDLVDGPDNAALVAVGVVFARLGSARRRISTGRKSMGGFCRMRCAG